MIIPQIYFLQEDEQLLLESFTRKWTRIGPGTVFVPPFVSAKKMQGRTLSPTEFLKIKNMITGEVRVKAGPSLVFLEASEMILEQYKVFVLKQNEYMKIIDNSSGGIRVEVGEKYVVLNPYEEVLQESKKGINIDEHTAVIVRNTKNGSLELHTDKGVFFPSSSEEIESVEKKILLENHETVIVRDKDGNFRIVRGSEEKKSFFLRPYEKLLELRWSSGIHKNEKNLTISRIDSRPKFMWYEFEVRTKDNVELILGITFFWQIINVEKMIGSTDDAPGDVCSHARSMIIQSVSKSTLESFLEKFNDIVKNCILGTEDLFYSERGVNIHSVEVRSIVCKNESTQSILQEIIQETTNRLNKLQKQESENDIELNKVRGRIEAEKQKTELISIESENKKKEAQIVGEAEAIRVKSFFDGLGSSVENGEKVRIFNILKKEGYIEKLSKGNAHMYFTPKDVNLSIESSD